MSKTRVHKNDVKKQCKKCGCDFYIEKSKTKQKFCSLKCHIAYHNVERVCKRCKKIFYVKKSHTAPAIYCSRKCVGHKNKKICKHCKKVFYVSDCFVEQKFCSKQCADDEYRILVICKTCGKEFVSKLYCKDTVKYCSKKCKNYCEKLSLVCKKCGKNFERYKWQKRDKSGPDYCSQKCYNNREDDIFVKCDGCKKEIKIYPSQKKYHNKHYCSNKCKNKYGFRGRLTGSLKFSSNYQKFISKVRHCVGYFEWRNKVRERDNNSCSKCGNKEDLTVHHKYITMYDFFKKYGFNAELIYQDKMFFDIKNGETLCRSCHAKEHTSSK